MQQYEDIINKTVLCNYTFLAMIKFIIYKTYNILMNSMFFKTKNVVD